MDASIPQVLSLDDVDAWTDSADVVVAGVGMAGCCAAIDAVGAGADVLVLEKAGAAGGTTALAAGQVYLGGGTPTQVATGHNDTVDAMFAYLEAVTPDPDLEKIRLYCEQSVEHFGWLEAQGVKFERTYYAGKAVFQPGTEGVMYTGNEKVWPFRDKAAPAPRGHKVAAPAETGGREAIRALTERIEALSARVQYDTGVVALVMDEGRVIGVRTNSFGAVAHVRARRGVVLAAGGYVMNKAMLAQYTPQLSGGFIELGTPNDDGLGIRLGQSAGGVPIHMDGAFISAPFYPPGSLLKGIIVNKHGKRFVAEDSYHGRTGGYVVQQPDRVAYLIIDEPNFGRPEIPLTPFIDGWDTIAELEHGLNLAAGSVQTTLDEYNKYAADGDDPEFHKHPDWVAPLEQGPWAAFDLTIGKAMYVGFTLGGLTTSIDAEVLDAAGVAIPGLFAAGACASNIAQDSTGYSSGTCIGESSFFGRRAGRKAATA